MKVEFWQQSWKERGSKTSFHRPDIHPFVKQHAPPYYLKGKRVFVPLAGKTNALNWFRQYADHTIGVELVEAPIHEFFRAHNLDYRDGPNGKFKADKITFLNCDLFSLTPQDIGKIDFVYDRASLIAFPYEMRLKYLEKMDELCSIGSQTLLITLEYEPYMDSPPFSITPAEVKTYYGEKYDIKHIEEKHRPEHRMKEKFDLNLFIEHAFILTKRK